MIISSKLSPRFFALSLTALFLTVLLLTACGGGDSTSKSQPQEGLNPSQQEQNHDPHWQIPARQPNLISIKNQQL